ncbi:MAG: GspE/PulE family protein [Gemmatimonadota bacterium]
MIQVQTRVLGKLLVASQAISEGELSAALLEQRDTRERLGEVLIRRGTDAEVIARTLAQQLRLNYAQPPLRPEPAALKLVNRALAERLRAVPLVVRDKSADVALADPLDLAAVDDLEFQTGRRVTLLVASAAAIESGLKAYDAETVVKLVNRLPAARTAAPADAEVAALQRASEAAPIVALVDHLLHQAIALGASDLHIEPSEAGLLVRARLDGLLSCIAALPAEAALAVVSRLKILAGLDISIKRRPQDGRATLRVQDRVYALRLSTLPTRLGEKVVLRILDPQNSALPLDQIGLPEDSFRKLRRMLDAPHGIILVTGPTGSGKTTTLYSALGALDRETRNIITIEDPVEYRLPGITQVQVHARAGLGFAAALRAILRQDPDVIMVGELRDEETVDVALQAAGTGHLVLSTLHTNDAPSTVSRLFNLKAPAYLVASALVGIIAQRLVRLVCSQCGGSGCGRCRQGYRGRTGVYEVMPVTPALRDLIAQAAPDEALRTQARADGMRLLTEDARRLVAAGITTAQEAAPLLQA